MQCVVIGRESCSGVSAKTKKPYDFVNLFVAGEKTGVVGKAVDKIFLSRDRSQFLCELAESIEPGQIIDVIKEREFGGNYEIITDIRILEPLAVVE